MSASEKRPHLPQAHMPLRRLPTEDTPSLPPPFAITHCANYIRGCRFVPPSSAWRDAKTAQTAVSNHNRHNEKKHKPCPRRFDTPLFIFWDERAEQHGVAKVAPNRVVSVVVTYHRNALLQTKTVAALITNELYLHHVPILNRVWPVKPDADRRLDEAWEKASLLVVVLSPHDQMSERDMAFDGMIERALNDEINKRVLLVSLSADDSLYQPRSPAKRLLDHSRKTIWYEFYRDPYNFTETMLREAFRLVEEVRPLDDDDDDDNARAPSPSPRRSPRRVAPASWASSSSSSAIAVANLTVSDGDDDSNVPTRLVVQTSKAKKKKTTTTTT